MKWQYGLNFYQSQDSRPVKIGWNMCRKAPLYFADTWEGLGFRNWEGKNHIRLLTKDVSKTNFLLIQFFQFGSLFCELYLGILSTKKGAVDKREGSWFFNTQHVWLGNNTPKQPSTYQPSRWKAGTGKSTLVFLDKTSTFKQYYMDWGVYSIVSRFWHLKIFYFLMKEWMNIFLHFSDVPIGNIH